MPQRFVVFYSCSLCEAEFDNPGATSPWSLTGDGETRAYDVCKSCAEGEFAVFLAKGIIERGGKSNGSKPPAARFTPPPVLPEPPVPGEVPCSYCDGRFTARGLPQHLSRVHNVKSQSAVKDETIGKGPHKCPDCSFGAKGPQGLAAHRHHNHGYVGANAAPKKVKAATG